MAVGPCHTGGPFLLRTGAAGGGLGGTKGARSPSSVAGSVLSVAQAAQKIGWSISIIRDKRYDPAAQGVSHLHLHTCLVHELYMLVAKVTCLLG